MSNNDDVTEKYHNAAWMLATLLSDSATRDGFVHPGQTTPIMDAIVNEAVRRAKDEIRAVPQTRCPTAPESWGIMMTTVDDRGNRAEACISEHPTRELAQARIYTLRLIFHAHGQRMWFNIASNEPA